MLAITQPMMVMAGDISGPNQSAHNCLIFMARQLKFRLQCSVCLVPLSPTLNRMQQDTYNAAATLTHNHNCHHHRNQCQIISFPSYDLSTLSTQPLSPFQSPSSSPTAPCFSFLHVNPFFISSCGSSACQKYLRRFTGQLVFDGVKRIFPARTLLLCLTKCFPFF